MIFGMLHSELSVLLFQFCLFWLHFPKRVLLALMQRWGVLLTKICFAFGNITFVAILAYTLLKATWCIGQIIIYISHKKNYMTRGSKLFSCEHIRLWTDSMNGNNKTYSFYKIKYYLKGHSRSNQIIFYIKRIWDEF